jgi:ankyrin repeat protein
MDMTKFEGEDDPGFIAVAGELRRWCKEVSLVTAQRAVTPLLLIAAASPSIDALERGLRITPDINITEDGPLKRNALHMAAISNQPKNLSLLLRAGMNVHATVDGGITPLFLACMFDHAEVVTVLIEEGNEDPNGEGLKPKHSFARSSCK